MDEELQQLEAELKRLRPRVPAVELRDRIERELSGQRRVSRPLSFWAAVPLAAALAMAFFLRSGTRPAAPVIAPARPQVAAAPTTPAVFKPVAMQNLLYAARDDGIVTLADGRMARQVQKAYVDTVVWRNPRTNASLTWTLPRKEVAVVPVSFQ